MEKGTRALTPVPGPKPGPGNGTGTGPAKPRIALSSQPLGGRPDPLLASKSTTDSQESKSDTKSAEKNVPTIPETEGLEPEQFVNTLLLRLLRAKVVDDSKTDRRNSESLEDGPPSRADVHIGASEIIRLNALATTVLLSDKCLLRIEKSVLPMLIVGDIHGQFIHLRSLFEMFGGPSEISLLFLGDYVDRGVQGIECMCLLLAIKIKYPKRVFMLRGNHEDANTTLSYGFHEECLTKYKSDGQSVWESFVNVFNVLPLAAIVNKKIFCVHGGLSPYMQTVEDIDKITRPLLIPAFGLATDLVWADPDLRNPGWSLSPRGVSFNFDAKAVEEFCKKNGVDLIVRGHQISTDMHNSGYKFFCGGRLVTIFSAPNYLNYHNAAAVMRVSKDMIISMTVFRSAEESDRESERAKRDQFMKQREERRKARKKAPPPPSDVVTPEKNTVSDPDTSGASELSEEDKSREMSARDMDPENDKKEGEEKKEENGKDAPK